MSLVSLKELLQEARSRRYAVPMFDVSNATMIRAAIEAAELENSPVILAAIAQGFGDIAAQYPSYLQII